MRSWRFAVLACALLASPAAAAGPDEVEASSDAPVRLSGDVAVSVAGGSLVVLQPGLAGPAVVHAFSGRAELWTWRSVVADADGLVEVVAPRDEDAVVTAYDVAASDVALDVDPAAWAMTVVARGEGTVRVLGTFDGEGRPERLASDLRESERPLSGVPKPGAGSTPPGSVPWSCRRGDAFVGDHTGGGLHAGFPAAPSGRASAEGPLDAQVDGGRVDFVDASGTPRSFRLGSWRAADDPGVPGAERLEHARLILRGSATGADLPTGENWGLCGATTTWDVDGALGWDAAEGRVRYDGGDRRFEDARVVAEGRFRVRHDAPPVALGATRYVATGDFDAVKVDGVPAGRPSQAAAAGPAVAAAAVVAALALLRFALALYSRVPPGRVLDHPARRALYDLVRAEEGIHQRALQRRSGLAWGLFAFHYRVLVRAGLLVEERRGRYTFVRTAATRPAAVLPAFRDPMSRRVWEVLPDDATPVPMRDLRARLAMSPQLLRYHLAKLEADGLVALSPVTASGRSVARVPAPSARAPQR